jgi:hypothetical protein
MSVDFPAPLPPSIPVGDGAQEVEIWHNPSMANRTIAEVRETRQWHC